jgi:hypothetical protein
VHAWQIHGGDSDINGSDAVHAWQIHGGDSDINGSNAVRAWQIHGCDSYINGIDAVRVGRFMARQRYQWLAAIYMVAIQCGSHVTLNLVKLCPLI